MSKRKHIIFDSSDSDSEAPRKKHKAKQEIKIAPMTQRFPTVFNYQGGYDSGETPRTLLELSLMQYSAAIRSKPNWWEKIKDPNIKSKWIHEAKFLSKHVIDYAFKELERYYMKLIDGPIVPSPVDGVYQADHLIPTHIKQALIAGAALLENVPDSQKDWHPDSNGQVLDLVHPSLYCYVQGKTRVTDGTKMRWRKFLRAGEPEPKPDKNKRTNKVAGRSAKYQWLPSEFKIDDGGKVTIESYINNLHPKQYKGLYDTIASVFERFVPLFNKTLTDALHPRENRIYYRGVHYERHWQDFANYEDYLAYEDIRQPIQPVLPEFNGVPAPKEIVNLNGRTVQVIVKMANIVLTPDNPKYDGGVWHVEGMDNERIIATGIYYYTHENITESQLGFRVSVHEPDYEQNDRRGVEEIYGLHNGDMLVQSLGSVITQQDRCVVFPNLYQHKVAPFKLADPTKPGVRKILCFFLVDPATPVISTARVPPQQAKWILKEKKFLKNTYFALLPKEIQDLIIDYHEDSSLAAALKHRTKLMAERKYFESTNKEKWERPFSLCEH